MNKNISLGIELGSTRIKAVLIDGSASVLASGSYEWENILTNGLWSYPLELVTVGLQESYRELKAEYKKKYGESLCEVGSIGISGMMHGYLAFDKDENLLTPFRTWRNTNAAPAAAELSDLFSFNIPPRWSVAHFYQAVLNGEEHVNDVCFLTTLSGYVHYLLTGKKVIGVCDASGMFPISGGKYNYEMIAKFNKRLAECGINKDFLELLPEVMVAGECAGVLTERGARLLDPDGELKPGCILCPPEGDGGTGMIATNTVVPRSANVSAGTSSFLIAVLEKELDAYYKEIEIITTPLGEPVAMVHANNFASEITAWTNLFEEVVKLSGGSVSRGSLFDLLYKSSQSADRDLGGLMGYNFLAGEPIADVAVGTPLIMRAPGGKLTLANLMKMHIYSAIATMSIGMDILRREGVKIDSVFGHGGFFKTEFVGQSAMSAAMGAPITVMKNAAEGGAWGIAVLALFAANNTGSLKMLLDKIFEGSEQVTVMADEREMADFSAFMEKYRKGLAVERIAYEHI